MKNDYLLDNHIVIHEKIGYGNFSNIYKGYHSEKKIKVAIKKMKKSIGKEISIMKNLQHENIIHLYNSFNVNNSIYLILELCKYDLSTYIRHNTYLSEDKSREIFKQIVFGMNYLHESQIIHRDLKPHNILLTENNKVKICDFGFSCLYTEIDYEICGSPFYMAPEMLTKKKYDDKIDLWSLGIILFQMLEGKVPYTSNTIKDLLKELENINFSLLISDHLSLNCKKLIENLLIIDPIKRICWNSFFNHDWLVHDTSPITIPQKNIIEEPIFNNHFHCFSDESDYLVINSPPQNDISTDYKQPKISHFYKNFKDTFKYFSI
tara:strand:- start:263 stop:1225 length:963 start_codon:yes stop_codon:yes gene_type:complete